MPRLVLAVLFTFIMLIGAVTPGLAQHSGGMGGVHAGGTPSGAAGGGAWHGGGSWHGGGAWHGGGWHGGGWHGGHWHGSVFIGGPWWVDPWWGWWPYPYAYTYPYVYYPYGYYPYGYVPPDDGPTVYIQKQTPAVQDHWYYCASAKGYYPTVSSCPEAWIKVPPVPG